MKIPLIVFGIIVASGLPSFAQVAPRSEVAAVQTPRQAHLDDLIVVRGRILDVAKEGVFVQCDNEPATVNPAAFRVDPSAGAGDIARMAELANRMQERKFGPLMEVRNGRLQLADYKPKALAEGVVLLISHPQRGQLAKGQPINVVTVAEKENVYTMNYTLTGEAARAWMWKRTSLDRPAKR